MGLRQYEQYIEQHEIEEIIEQPHTDPTPGPSKKSHKKRKAVSKGEKILFILYSVFTVFCGTILLHNQAQINEINREVHSMSIAINDIQKENGQLLIQINEKSSYERIWQKAKERGLHLNESNVKVVPGR